MSKQWFALQVHAGREKYISSYLTDFGFEQLLLLRQEKRQRSDRIKTIATPVFSGYVFCRLDLEERVKVLAGPGVLRIVGFGRNPEPVDDEEIAALQILNRVPCQIEEFPYLKEGDSVRIEGGSLDGLVGRFVRTRSGCRVVVSVTILHRSVAIEIERARLTVVKDDEDALHWRRPVLSGIEAVQQGAAKYLVSSKNAS